jgi:hypothetical protein
MLLVMFFFNVLVDLLIKNQFTFYVGWIKEHFSHVCHPSGLPISESSLPAESALFAHT